jgi:hypothetical protein
MPETQPSRRLRQEQGRDYNPTWLNYNPLIVLFTRILYNWRRSRESTQRRAWSGWEMAVRGCAAGNGRPKSGRRRRCA